MSDLAFTIVCPKCRANDTLVYTVREVKNYPLFALPSTKNPAHGTYRYAELLPDHTSRTTATYCSIPECDFEQAGTMPVKAVVFPAL